MPTIETVETHHDKAATTTCSVDTVKSTRQSASSGLMKETKHQRRVLTEMVMGITARSMTVTATGMTVTLTGMTVMATAMTVTATGMTAHISCLVL
eukprot:9854785-Ditylum_brightwellii.AAC.1